MQDKIYFVLHGSFFIQFINDKIRFAKTFTTIFDIIKPSLGNEGAHN